MCIRDRVEEADLAKVIELWTGIPASRIQENELKKLADLESVLNLSLIHIFPASARSIFIRFGTNRSAILSCGTGRFIIGILWI